MDTFTFEAGKTYRIKATMSMRVRVPLRDLTVAELRDLATYGSLPERPDPLPPKRGPVTLDDLTPAEQSLLRPPAWMRPCRHDHGRPL